MSDDDDHQIGYQALPRGVPVVTSDGIRIGTVHRVLDNAREHIFDGIVVKTDHGSRFVDAPEVARITLRQVTPDHRRRRGRRSRQSPRHRGEVGETSLRAQPWPLGAPPRRLARRGSAAARRA